MKREEVGIYRREIFIVVTKENIFGKETISGEYLANVIFSTFSMTRSHREISLG